VGVDRARIAYAVAALFAAAFLALLAKRRIDKALERRRARLRGKRAIRGERDAEKLLRSLGYTIEARQPPAVWTVVCEGTSHDIALRADLLVRRGRARFVAEVKTGEAAPRLTTGATRRQLLEYRVAYDVDGVLLVDMEAGRVMDVEFPLARARPGARLAPVVAALLTGAGLGFAAATWLSE
jgi:hypothetical protein